MAFIIINNNLGRVCAAHDLTCSLANILSARSATPALARSCVQVMCADVGRMFMRMALVCASMR